MKHKKIAALILSCAFALSGCGGAGRQDKEQTQETQSADAAGDTEAWQKAEESPYAAYPELVTYTLGQMSGVTIQTSRMETPTKIMSIRDIFGKC